MWQVASVLLERVGPHPDDASELLITLAERIALRQYKSVGEDDRPILVAQLLQLAETKGRSLPLKPSAPTVADVARILCFVWPGLDPGGYRRALRVGLQVWFWAMPKMDQLAEQCEVRWHLGSMMMRGGARI